MVIEQPDAEGEALRELGRQTDIADSRPVSEGAQEPDISAPPAEAPEPPQRRPEITPDSEPEPTPQDEPPLEPAARDRDERGRFTGAQPPQENGQQQEQPRSRYAQARERESKEQVRKDRSWTALAQERDALRSEQAQWEEARRVEQLQQYAQTPPLQKAGIDLAGYHQAYLQFRENGDWENATKSLETVLELEQMGRQGIESRQEAQYELAWRRDMENVLSAVPDLQNAASPLTQETDRIINEHPYLFYIPQGFQKAVEIATLLLAAGSDSELREENDRLRAQIEGYHASSQPARGGPGQPPRGRPPQEEMTLDEEEAYLRDLTNREDAVMGR